LGVKTCRPRKPRDTSALCRRASAYTAAPDATFAPHVSRKTSQPFITPRPARKAPSDTATSAGTGGKKFSTAANTAITA
jgi:hypothetical protein